MKKLNPILIVVITVIFLFEQAFLTAQEISGKEKKQNSKNTTLDRCVNKELEKIILFSKNKNWEFKSDRNVVVSVVIKNNYVDDLYFIKANPYFDFKINIKTVKGLDVDLSEQGRKITEPPEASSRYQIKLKKCEELEFELKVSELYELKLGKYVVEVERKILSPDKKSRITVKSKPFFLTIK